MRGATGDTGWSSDAFSPPRELGGAAEGHPRVVEVALGTDSAAPRPFVVLAGPVLRMHSQPAYHPYAHVGRKRQKLKNLCWVPIVSTVVHHYTGKALSCDEVVSTVGTSEGLDVAQDPVEVLECHWGIGSRDAYADSSSPALSHAPLYVRNDSEEAVSSAWWLDLRTSVDAKHPVFLLGERLDAKTVRAAIRDNDNYCHCLLVVGYEGALATGPRSSDARRARRGAAPRLRLKDPCLAERIVEATCEAEGGAVQLHTFARGSRRRPVPPARECVLWTQVS